MLVEDARKDYSFSDNPLVIDESGVVFHLGISINTVDNYPLGTLWVVDKEPGTLTDNQIKMMQALASQTNRLLEERKNNIGYLVAKDH